MDRMARIRRVKRLAGRTRAVLLILWALCAIMLLGSLAGMEEYVASGGAIRLRGVVLQPADWCAGPCQSLGDYGALFLTQVAIHAGAYLSLWLWGTWSFERLLRLYQLGRVFGRDSARRLRDFGTSLVLWAVLDLFGWMLWASASAAGRVAVETDLAALSTVLIGFIFWIIAYVMGEASELAQEVELTV